MGNDKDEFIDNTYAEGSFFDLLDAGMAFFFKHLNLHGKVVGLNRVEDLDIPVEALREALINALCHRSYDSISGSVSLAIYDDRIEIENPGRIPALTGLRDSGSIEQDADKVIMIQKVENHVSLAIRKNSQGLGGDVGIKLISDSVYCNFSEVETDNDLQ